MKYVFYLYLSTLKCEINYYSLETNLDIFENVSGKKYVITFIKITTLKKRKLLIQVYTICIQFCVYKLLLGS